MNQTELTQRLSGIGVDINSSYISQIENMGKIPSAEVLVGLSRILKTSTDYLLMLTLAKAKARADTGYVDGNLDPADYTAQVQRLRAQQAQIEAEIERLEAQVVSAAQRDSRRLRVADLAAAGLVRLDSADTTATNMWLRERLRLTVHANKDISIDFI